MKYGKIPVSHCTKTTALMLVATTAFGVYSASAAQAQVAYDSLTNPVIAGSQLPDRIDQDGAAVRAATDDYVTTLFPANQPEMSFQLSTLTFFGGVEFTGPSTRENSTLVFRFLRFDGLPQPFNRTEVQFTQSGNFEQTVQINALIPQRGFLEISTLPNSNATAFFAFGSTPTVGQNDPNNGNPAAIRAFRLTAGSAAPEPGSVALIAAAALPLVGLVHRRRGRK